MNVPTSLAAIVAAALGLVTLAGGCATSSAPPAQSSTSEIESRFRKLDADGDGKVTRAEFNAGFADQLFAIYNRQKDGVITKAEWEAVERANESRTESSFRALDRNHDGRLTRGELTSGPRRDAVVKRLFDRIDTNHDGILTLAEARAFGIKRTTNQDPANHP